jgi:tRNA-dihydrouridine synthase B
LISIGKIQTVSCPVLLAPLEDITDAPFRQICKEFDADIVYTEFISSEGLIRDADKSTKKLRFDESERPLGIQIFGHDVDSMVKAAEMAEMAMPNIIDLNFGCPVRKVVNKGGGAALLKDIPLMLKMTKEVVKRVKLPVTVKTRLGWDEANKPILDLSEQLQDCGISGLTIHGRTRSQLYGGKADWTLIGEVKNNPRIHIPIIGNGDVTSPEIAKQNFDKYAVDGIMIGRAAIGNPWIFKQCRSYLDNGIQVPPPTMHERIEVCRNHIKLSVDYKGEQRTLFEMRKFYGGYFKGLPGIKQLRMKLVEAGSNEEVMFILQDALKNPDHQTNP